MSGRLKRQWEPVALKGDQALCDQAGSPGREPTDATLVTQHPVKPSGLRPYQPTTGAEEKTPIPDKIIKARTGC